MTNADFDPELLPCRKKRLPQAVEDLEIAHPKSGGIERGQHDRFGVERSLFGVVLDDFAANPRKIVRAFDERHHAFVGLLEYAEYAV